MPASVPGAPNDGESNLGEEIFRGIPLIAFGSGRCVVILRRDTLALVQVTEDLQGNVRAVCWGGLGGSAPNQHKVSDSRDVADPLAEGCWQHGEDGAPRKGSLAVAVDSCVLVLLPCREQELKTGFPSYLWQQYFRLEVQNVVHLIWCPTSDLLVSCSSKIVCGWKIEMPSCDRNVLEGQKSQSINVLHRPIWSSDSAEHLEESSVIGKPSFTYDGAILGFPLQSVNQVKLLHIATEVQVTGPQDQEMTAKRHVYTQSISNSSSHQHHFPVMVSCPGGMVLQHDIEVHQIEWCTSRELQRQAGMYFMLTLDAKGYIKILLCSIIERTCEFVWSLDLWSSVRLPVDSINVVGWRTSWLEQLSKFEPFASELVASSELEASQSSPSCWIVAAGPCGILHMYEVQLWLGEADAEIGRDRLKLVQSIPLHLHRGPADVDVARLTALDVASENDSNLHEKAIRVLVITETSGIQGTLCMKFRKLEVREFLLESESFAVMSTRGSLFVSHSYPIKCISAHCMLPLLATSCDCGETVVWWCEDSLVAKSPLMCKAVLDQFHSAMAWSPWLEESATIWNSALLWALSTDGAMLSAYSICSSFTEGLRNQVTPTYKIPILDDWFGEVSTSLARLFTMSEGTATEDSKSDKIDTQIIVAVLNGTITSFKISVGADKKGYPHVVNHATIGSVLLEDATLVECFAGLDHMDCSWKCDENCWPTVMCGSRNSVIHRYEIKNDGIDVTKDFCRFSCDATELTGVAIVDIVLISFWEMLILVLPERSSEDSAARLIGYVLERSSEHSWCIESVLPRTFSRRAKASSYVCGDSSPLLAVLDDNQIVIFSQQPTGGAHYLQRSSNVEGVPEEHRSMFETVQRASLRNWMVIRTGSLSTDVTLERASMKAMLPQNGQLLSKNSISWCRDGSIAVFGMHQRMFVLAAGVSDSHPNFRHRTRNIESGTQPRKSALVADAMKQRSVALWTQVDSLCLGPCSVYYHPVVLEQAIMMGRLKDAEERLNLFLSDLQSEMHFGFCHPQPLRDTPHRQSAHSVITGKDGSSSLVGTAPKVLRDNAIASGYHYNELHGVDMGPLKKVAAMKLPDASKVVPASTLFKKQPLLLRLLPEHGAKHWDEERCQLTCAPDWALLLREIESAEAESNRTVVPNPANEGNVIGSQTGWNSAELGHSAQQPALSQHDARSIVEILQKLLHTTAEGSSIGGTESNDSLTRILFPGLNRMATIRLIALVTALEELTEDSLRSGLDDAAKIYFVFARAHHHSLSLMQSMSSDTGDTIRVAPLNGYVVSFALHSDSQDTLTDRALPDEMDSWENYSPALWVDSTSRLRAFAERLAKKAYCARQDPMDALLFYVLARKTTILYGLFKKAGQEKIAQFLQRDFAGDETARQSACKNAFSLMAKGQREAAAAFFLLGGALENAVNLAALNLCKPMLALLICRLAAADGESEAASTCRLYRDTILPAAEKAGDMGIVHAVRWRLEEFGSSLHTLWSREVGDDAAASYSRAEIKEAGTLGGILARFEEDTQPYADVDHFAVADLLHPCTPFLLSLVSRRPKMRFALRGEAMHSVPMEQVTERAVRSLVWSGCSSLVLAADMLSHRRQSSKKDVELNRTTASAVSVCLARLCEFIQFISACVWRSGSGDISSQIYLSALKQEIANLTQKLRLNENQFKLALIRFCQVRGLWRIEHALVTGHYGRGGRDTSLAEVAVHPLTCAMTESVTSFAAMLCQDMLDDDVLARVERKGKLLQLILHSLTVDNNGDTGALTVLAASVMAVHFILIWARNDFGALKALLLGNEGVEDDDSAMALAWLMNVCNPAQFHVGSVGNCASKGHDNLQRCSHVGGTPKVRTEGHSDPVSDDDCSKFSNSNSDNLLQSANVILQEKARMCLKWLLAFKFHSRLAKALSGPKDDGSECCTRNISELSPLTETSPSSSKPFDPSHLTPEPQKSQSAAVEDYNITAGDRRSSAEAQPSPGPKGPQAADTSGFRILSQVTSWAKKRSSSLDRIHDHLKSAAHKASSRINQAPSPVHAIASSSSLDSITEGLLGLKAPCSSSVGSLKGEWFDSTPEAHSSGGKSRRKRFQSEGATRAVYSVSCGDLSHCCGEEDDSMSHAFFSSDGSSHVEAWQRGAPEGIGNRLLKGLGTWTRKMLLELHQHLRQLVIHPSPCMVGLEGMMHELPVKHEEGEQVLWKHYGGLERLHEQLERALSQSRGGGGLPETLEVAWAHFEKRNAVLKQMQYPGKYRGTLIVNASTSGVIAPPPSNMLNLLGQAVKAGSIFSFQPAAGGGALGGANMSLAGLQTSQTGWGGHTDFRPTTQLSITYHVSGASVDADALESASARFKSGWIKKTSAPNFNEEASFDVAQGQFGRHLVRVELVEKHKFGEEVIGLGTCDVSHSMHGPHRSRVYEVALRRPESFGQGVAGWGEEAGKAVCLAKLCVHFIFELDPHVLAPHSDASPMGPGAFVDM